MSKTESSPGSYRRDLLVILFVYALLLVSVDGLRRWTDMMNKHFWMGALLSILGVAFLPFALGYVWERIPQGVKGGVAVFFVVPAFVLAPCLLIMDIWHGVNTVQTTILGYFACLFVIIVPFVIGRRIGRHHLHDSAWR